LRIIFCTPGSIDYADYKGNNLLGIESQVFGLAKELTKRGHEIYILRRWHDNVKEETIEGIQVINVDSPDLPDLYIQKVLTKILFSRYAVKEIRRIRPGIIVLTDIASSFFLSKLKIAKIYVTHNHPGELSPDTSIFMKYPKKLLERRVFTNCEVLVALNNTFEEYLEAKSYKTVEIPNGVEIGQYNPNYFDNRYILSGGRLVKIKGLQYLIKAYSMINKNLREKYKLVIVGYGPEKENLEKLVIELRIRDRVDFIPWLSKDKFIKKISKCSIFVLPSSSECMPVSLLEAMASGKSVIASDIPGPQDIITHGHDGFLFEKENANELKKCLELCLSDRELRREIGENARKTIEKDYTFEKIADKYLILCYKLLKVL